MKKSSLEAVAAQVKHVAIEQRILEQRIREARATGLSLRVVAEAASMSHEQVRRITA